MARQIQEIMTRPLHTVPREATLITVAELMRDQEIGDVLVTNRDGTLRGIVTDRDIVVRAVAEGMDLETTRVEDICTEKVAQVSPTAPVDEAVDVMRERSVRRIPVVRDGVAVGIVTLGDVARMKDPGSVLADISSAEPNR